LPENRSTTVAAKKKMTNRIKKVPTTYWDMTPEQKWSFVADILSDYSPNDEVRNKKKKKDDGPAR
jgi:hypothetical protein